MSEELDITTLAGMYTAQETVKEATAFRTLPKGWYRLRIEKADLQADTGEMARVPGRPILNLQCDAYDILTGEKKGKQFVKASPFVHRNPKDDGSAGGLDTASKVWAQFYKAVTEKDGPPTDAVEVISRIRTLGVFDGFVDEYVKMPDNTFGRFKTPEERARLIEDGGEVKNTVSNVRAAKA